MKMSKADEIKNRVQSLKRSPHKALLEGEEDVNTISENVNVNDDVNMDINTILNTNRNKKSDKELVGIYFEPKVKSALDKMQKSEGRGAKSDFVNDVVKWALIQKGYRLD